MSAITSQFFGPLSIADTWTTRQGVTLQTASMSPAHRRNVVTMLRSTAEQQKASSILAATNELIDTEDFYRIIELTWEIEKLRAQDADTWLESTPLVQALLDA